MNRNYIIIAILIFALVLLIELLLLGITNELQNGNVLNKTVTITGKVCPVSFNSGKIQDSEGGLYFIPEKDCNNYVVNSTRVIYYNHIHQFTIGNWADFDRVVGDY